MRRHLASASLFVLFVTLAPAEAPPTPLAPSAEMSVPIVSYGSAAITKAVLKGTDLAPGASGLAKLSSKRGSLDISASVRDLPAATSFGPEFLTYVVWAVTAEGRPRNLGEIRLKNGKGKFHATTQAQAFGLVVTAEPYFAVGVPSELVVLRNAFEGAAAEKAAPAETRWLAFARSTYSGAAGDAPDAKATLDLAQAANATRIARSFGADAYARDLYTRAKQSAEQAETLAQDRKKTSLAASKAREAVQSAEAARSFAVRKIEEARVAAEKAAAAARTAGAEANAAEEARRRVQAEQTAADETRRRAQAEQTAAEEARRRAAAEQTAADAEAARRQAEAEKQTLRAKLFQQFNLILETRDSARGLIVNLGDVLFDLNKYSLRPEAREKLAKLSGILLAHSGLTLEVEGHTDSTGSDEYNQKLSEDRAGAVRDYLVEQKVTADAITANGFGKTRPVAANDTTENRQKNRRVEIVVSGDAIGTNLEQQKEAAARP